MQEAVGTKGMVFGYMCQRDPFAAVQRLYLMGARLVVWDYPSNTNVLKRHNIKRIQRISAAGDVLILSANSDLGRNRASQDKALKQFERNGVEVRILS